MRNCLISLDDYLPDGSPKQPGKTDTISDTIDETWGRGPIRGPIMIPTDDSKGKSLNQIYTAYMISVTYIFARENRNFTRLKTYNSYRMSNFVKFKVSKYEL